MPDATIICVSANPAMDRRLRVARLSLGEINRAASAQGFAGGKAAHVAMAAHAMAAKTVWIGFLGGPIGQECARQMKDLGIQVVAIPTAAETRVNLEIIEESGNVTEILEPGGKPTADERGEFSRVCVERIRNEPKSTLVVISGSLPAGLGPEFYVSLVGEARAAGARVYVDTSGDALRESSKVSPDFVKTNRAEAEALLGRPVKTRHEAVHAAMAMIENGAGSAAITLGAEGFVWVESKNGPVWTALPPRLEVISTVGCGDATLGGLRALRLEGLLAKKLFGSLPLAEPRTVLRPRRAGSILRLWSL